MISRSSWWSTAVGEVLNLHTLEGEYFGSAPTKRWTWSPSATIASNSKQYLSPISKHTFFKKIIISASKRNFLRYFTQKNHVIPYVIYTMVCMPQFHLQNKYILKWRSEGLINSLSSFLSFLIFVLILFFVIPIYSLIIHALIYYSLVIIIMSEWYVGYKESSITHRYHCGDYRLYWKVRAEYKPWYLVAGWWHMTALWLFRSCIGRYTCLKTLLQLLYYWQKQRQHNDKSVDIQLNAGK